MTTHEKYVKLITERYSHLRNESYEMMGNYDFALLGPEQYKTEASMLAYVEQNPDATLEEVVTYFDKITPDGLAPGDDGADLWDDD
ncbi:MAG: hypothetical protein LIO78_01445 [Clostridiales bacterium]|nr:hypothetical protein [Clostridiales bacterium]